ncbi:endolytic transglycosylase MltG [Alysiella filiformis]|nr:endolytic transglycosylase MltG [Alysiella filiformis]QMT32527.1 endolytic transglycosylase MltG [Alysiella filiformis]UBQ57392.1 endolytic transglycosylase MltG [Alysiella filiformis DSM 16848]
MFKKVLLGFVIPFIVMAAMLSWAMFAPVAVPENYRVRIEKGQGLAQVSQRLAQDKVIHSALAMRVAAYAQNMQNKMRVGNYKLPAQISTWDLLQHLQQRPDTTVVRVVEGKRFKDLRQAVNENPNLRHETLNWSDEKLLQTLDANAPSSHPEGLFFPDSYEADVGSSDLQIFQAAYRNMQKQLNQVWENRAPNLPYQNPYELLTMASIVEKETGHPDDRKDVAAVFRNRLIIGMRLQTDPTVIYGMGDAYQGKIRRADLERDTPYNTYTRAGLTPTPIALPSRAALEAAAHPSDAEYIYFVSRMDNTGRSQFSKTLSEHNEAVRKYILKK